MNDPTKNKTCPECDGTGSVLLADGTFLPCVVCNGTGELDEDEQRAEEWERSLNKADEYNESKREKS